VVEITLPARYGTLEIVSDTEVLYTPTEGYVGDDDFIYRVSDGSLSDAAVAVIHIAEANDDPVAENDEATTLPSAAVTVDVLANDSDPNGDPLQVSDVSQPSNGTAELIDGQITYTPDEGFAGVDTFWYAVVDGRGGSAVAYVDVTVNTPPVAEDDRSGAVPEETTLLHVLGNDWDPDGDALTVVECSSMQGCDVTLNADSTIAFTPLPGFHGIDEISYTVADIYGATDTAVVEVRVNTPPLAVDDNVLTAQDVPLLISVLDNDGDADGDVLSVVGTTAPANGEAVLEGNTVVYRPNAGFWGSDSFTYTVDDSWGGTATATVTVTVNAPPAADADATTVHAGHEVLIDVLTNDSDPEGGALTLHAVGLPLIGEAQIDGGEIRYTAPVGQTGEDTFSYTIRDEHGAEATGTVTVTILPNDPPTTADDSGTTAVDTPLALDVLANDSDPEGGSLTVLAVTSADHGNVTIEADGTLTYTPVGGFVGEDSFSYQVADDVGQVAWATVTITVE
jgi:hypothetical protein